MSTVLTRLPAYDVAREEGVGAVVSIDVHGHLTYDDLDAFLAAIDRDPEEFYLEEAPRRGFNVTTYLRSSVHPEDCDDPDGPDCWHDYNVYDYRAIPPEGLAARDGEVVVTCLEVDNTWTRRCFRHRDEVATLGLPEAEFLPPEEGEDPPPFVGGYLYMCADCASSHSRRHEVAVRIWADEIKRRRGAGLPERLIYA